MWYRERTERALVSIGKDEANDIFREQREKGEKEQIELECHFCDKKYIFTKEYVDKLFEA